MNLRLSDSATVLDWLLVRMDWFVSFKWSGRVPGSARFGFLDVRHSPMRPCGLAGHLSKMVVFKGRIEKKNMSIFHLISNRPYFYIR